jgi:tRNA uridine 5-carboxymethylaminomethyl modification enzyme
MFTSRAEHRILLRQDNADERLMPLGYKLGLISEERHNKFLNKYSSIKLLLSFITKLSVKPEEINPFLLSIDSKPISQSRKLIDIILRPEVELFTLSQTFAPLKNIVERMNPSKKEIIESTDIRIKYGGYIEREKLVAEKVNRLDHVKINEKFDYMVLNSISTEARQKLARIKPKTIGQARRIPGVSPSDINILLVYLGR